MKPLLQLLDDLVNHADGLAEDPRWASSMRDMLGRHGEGRLTVFSGKQAAYIRETHEKVFDEPIYTNDFSAGKVALGEALRTRSRMF